MRAAYLAVVLLLLSSCTARTLPLPPPIVQSLSAPDPQGMVHVSGLCHEGASVGVMNEATSEGVVTASPEVGCDSSCPWEARIRADEDDPIRVWQFFETESSLQVVVPGR
jgi:hypothetical protein